VNSQTNLDSREQRNILPPSDSILKNLDLDLAQIKSITSAYQQDYLERLAINKEKSMD
jgi:hypothetical protein